MFHRISVTVNRGGPVIVWYAGAANRGIIAAPELQEG
jgi:hypothetical protein